MSEWREDSFLEKLADSPKRGGLGCAEAEALCASVDAEGVSAIPAKLLRHIKHCPICLDLQRRLLLFDQADGSYVDAETVSAEKRLDSWLKGFLASRSFRPQAPHEVLELRAIPKPSIGKPRRFWRIQWALAAAATIVIATSVGYIWHSISALTSSWELARHTPGTQAPGPPNPLISPMPTSPGQPPVSSQAAESPALSNPRTHGSSNHGAPPPISAESHALSDRGAPWAKGTQGQSAAVNPGSSPSTMADNAPAESHEPGAGAVSGMAAKQGPEGAQRNPPLGSNALAHALTRTPVPASLSATPAGPAASSAHKTVGPNYKPAAGPSTLVPIYLPAGTRIWVSIESTTAQLDGHFQFTGTLLQAVTVSGVILLDKGTPLAGLGYRSVERKSLQVTECLIRGSRYKLRIAPGAAELPAGSGKVVEFEGGKVLEMWLETDTILDPVAGGAGVSPNRPKVATPSSGTSSPP